MRLSPYLLILIIVFMLIGFVANAQTSLTPRWTDQIPITIVTDDSIPSSYTYHSIDISPTVILGDSVRSLTPREIFFKFYPRVNKDNYDCWSSFFSACYPAKNIKCVDVRLMSVDYTFEELKQYLFYETETK